MTRRERILRILQNFGRSAEWHRTQHVYRKGWDAFTDEALEQIARDTVRSYRWQNKENAKARALRKVTA